ncbi:hypothetical protein CR513_47052, partial [Mucuna pruriens]
MNNCIYLKVSGNKICFLMLYVDDILLATYDNGLLYEVKQFFSKNFDIKDMGVSYVIDIKIYRERSRDILGLSQKTYINKCPKNDFAWEHMENISYASIIGSLMYAQFYTRLDIAYFVGVLGRYKSNPGVDQWKVAKKVMRYLQRIKNYIIMYRQINNLEVIAYSNSEYTSCVDS